MSKYINTDELLAVTDRLIVPEAAEAMKDIANSIPAADVVEVVRCKDCKYVWKHENGCYECGNGFCEVKADFFCADGERRESE